jgi:hypothetical protein
MYLFILSAYFHPSILTSSLDEPAPLLLNTQLNNLESAKFQFYEIELFLDISNSQPHWQLQRLKFCKITFILKIEH